MDGGGIGITGAQHYRRREGGGTQVVDIDRYGREVAKVWVGPLDGNLEQVKRGMAWAYRKYAREPRYYEAEDAAQKAKTGLWVQSNPIPPREFRKKIGNVLRSQSEQRPK